jgi:hypothetical protein
MPFEILRCESRESRDLEGKEMRKRSRSGPMCCSWWENFCSETVLLPYLSEYLQHIHPQIAIFVPLPHLIQVSTHTPLLSHPYISDVCCSPQADNKQNKNRTETEKQAITAGDKARVGVLFISDKGLAPDLLRTSKIISHLRSPTTTIITKPTSSFTTHPTTNTQWRNRGYRCCWYCDLLQVAEDTSTTN